MANLFDKYDYIAYPSTILELTKELIKIIDDYRARKLTNAEVSEIILFYAENEDSN